MAFLKLEEGRKESVEGLRGNMLSLALRASVILTPLDLAKTLTKRRIRHLHKKGKTKEG